jgi:hypothetical protein
MQIFLLLFVSIFYPVDCYQMQNYSGTSFAILYLPLSRTLNDQGPPSPGSTSVK